MNENKFFKLLCSLPIVLIALYFIPFIGICLIIFRYYVYRDYKYYSLPMYLVIFGFVLLIPKLLFEGLKLFKINLDFTTLIDVVQSDIYLKLIPYSKKIITIGLIFLMISFIFKNAVTKLLDKVKSGTKNYINKYEQEQREIREKNDLIVQERKEVANNTHLVTCRKCGADNTIVGKIGKCKYCGSSLFYNK